jgi:CheY-like chemotaxis protein
MARVLVVDDDPDFVKVTSKVLETAGYARKRQMSCSWTL